MDESLCYGDVILLGEEGGSLLQAEGFCDAQLYSSATPDEIDAADTSLDGLDGMELGSGSDPAGGAPPALPTSKGTGGAGLVKSKKEQLKEKRQQGVAGTGAARPKKRCAIPFPPRARTPLARFSLLYPLTRSQVGHSGLKPQRQRDLMAVSEAGWQKVLHPRPSEPVSLRILLASFG